MTKRRGLDRIRGAFGFSWRGLRACAGHEPAFRQELLVIGPLIPIALWLGQNALERAALTGVLVLVLIVEVLNSAIEACIDRIGPEWHPLSGRAKDMASGAVFLSIALALWVWALILVPRWL